MADYTVGLDFGTHQSKVCIEDASDPRNITYSFFKFAKLKKGHSYFLPSIVQINKDRTVSYGFVDESNALVTGQTHSFAEPKFIKPEAPELEKLTKEPHLIPIPFEAYVNSLSPKKRYLIQIEKVKVEVEENGIKKVVKKKQKKSIDRGKDLYAAYCNNLAQKERDLRIKWTIECRQIEERNKRKQTAYDISCAAAHEEYEKKHRYWEKSLVDTKAIYRYFKIATFSKGYKWTGEYPSKILSTWYLTFVLFNIFEVLPKEVDFQMGIPESIGDREYSKRQKKDAEDIFYEAMRLYRLFIRKEDFLSSSVDFLLSVTNYKNLDLDTPESGPFVTILPEAFAGLLSITKQGKINIGMTLLVDIGGGSTDISMFNVISNQNGIVPNISRIISLHKGLNYIFSLYREDHYELSLEQVRDLFEKDPSVFEPYIKVFHRELIGLIDEQFYKPLVAAAYRSGIMPSQLSSIVYNRPVVFSGGGGVYEEFHSPLHMFREPLSVSKDLLSLSNVTDKNISDAELSILAVAYGLSIPQLREPIMTPLDDLFAHIRIQKESARQSDYEHGLSDFD